jgi:hypothetical protein
MASKLVAFSAALFCMNAAWCFSPKLSGFSQRIFLRKSNNLLSSSLLCMSYDYDLIIVGCGVGGHGAALHARANGLKTAIFTGNDVGGTCVNRGCVPSKALLAAAGT